MKKKILLLICVGLMQPLIANEPLEERPINKKSVFLKLCGCMLAMGAIFGAGGYGLSQIPYESPEPQYPQCNPVERNHTQAQCVPNLPSIMWNENCVQLGGMLRRNQTCVPGCSFNTLEGVPVFSTGDRKETTLPEDELIRFHEYPEDEYQYVICETGSLLGKLKSRLTNLKIPFWTTETAPGANYSPTAPRQIGTYETEGLVLPLEYAREAYDQELYNAVVKNYEGPVVACYATNGLWCDDPWK